MIFFEFYYAPLQWSWACAIYEIPAATTAQEQSPTAPVRIYLYGIIGRRDDTSLGDGHVEACLDFFLLCYLQHMGRLRSLEIIHVSLSDDLFTNYTTISRYPATVLHIIPELEAH